MARRRTGKARTPPGRLRIVAGKWRSRVLPIVDAPGLRPTSARIRETLFNWLGDRIVGANCVDLFAGTGALGFEALSRGASHVTFVDTSRAVVDALHTACEALSAGASAEIVRQDAEGFLTSRPDARFDVVFLDPPYAANVLPDLLHRVTSHLTDTAFVYFELPRAQDRTELPAGWSVIRDKTAGQVRYCLATLDATQGGD